MFIKYACDFLKEKDVWKSQITAQNLKYELVCHGFVISILRQRNGYLQIE